MRREHIILISAVATSLAAGGVGGYFLAQRQLKSQFEDLANEEIQAAKEFYSKLNKADEFSTPEAAAEKLGAKVVKAEPVDAKAIAENAKEALDALKSYSSEPEDSEEEEVIQNVFVDGKPVEAWNYEEEMTARDPERPYVISYEEFFANEPENEQMSVTYFEPDDTLVDESNREIRDIDGLIGDDNLSRFGHGSRDNNILYVRNEKKGIDFEVLKNMGSYAADVLGIKEIKHSSYSVRRFRGDDE